LGDTLKPSHDVGLYIMTSQNPKYDYESIMGFGGLEWCVHGAMQIRWLTETVAQNRIVRIREQYSMWDGKSRMGPDFEDAPNQKILTRTCDGKIILELPNRNKPVCPKCKVNVLSLNDLCYKCNILAQVPRVIKRKKTPKQSFNEVMKEWLN